MKGLFNYIDANPDCIVLPLLVILLASLIAGIHFEVRKFQTEPNRSATKGLLLVFATVIVTILTLFYIILLIIDVWR